MNAGRERVLVTQFRRIGDALLTTPLLMALRAAHPDWHVTVLLDRACHEALAEHPAIDAVLAIGRDDWSHPFRAPRAWARVRAVHPSIAIDVLSTPFSAAVCRWSGATRRIGYDLRARRRFYTDAVPRECGGTTYTATARQALLAPLGIAARERAPSVSAGFADTAWAAAAMPLAGERPLVLLSTTSRRAARRWPSSYYAALATSLAAEGACVRLLWGPGEHDEAAAVCAQVLRGDVGLAPATPTLRALAGVLCRARVLVGNDNGTRHLAIALGVPTIGLFGCNDPAAWTPPAYLTAATHRVLRGVPGNCASPAGCAPPRCLESIAVETALEVVRAELALAATRR